MVYIVEYHRRDKIMELREALVRVEEDRQTGRIGCSPDELEAHLDKILHDAQYHG